MILPLLKTALEPVVQRQRLLHRMCLLAVAWLLVGGLAFVLWKNGQRGTGAAVTLLLSALVAWLAVQRIARAFEPDYLALARTIEHQHPDLHALLVTAVEQRPSGQDGKLDFLQQRVVFEAVAEVRRRNCLEAVPSWQLGGAALLQFALLGLLGFAFYSMLDSPTEPRVVKAAEPTEEVSVTPGDVELERGSGLIVMAKFTRSVPSEATLVFTPLNAQPKRMPLVKNLDDPVFGGGVPEVAGDLSYRVEYAGRSTREFRVKVYEHPRLDRADARISFPEYTKLPEKQIADTRRVSAVQGATLDVAFQLNKPVQSVWLVTKDGAVTPLTVDPAKALAELKGFAVRESRSWELKLKDADGRVNKVPANFTLDALANKKPELKVVTPKGDQRVSSIEEVAFRINAWDDFGVKAAGISYSVAGAVPQDIVLASDLKPDERRELLHVLKLEDLGVKVDELVSWHAWAEDIGPDGKPRRTETDMYFAEVRPFEEIFRPESGGGEGKGGGGEEAVKLAEIQKQIISATWNLRRGEGQRDPAAPSEKYLKDIPVVKESQEAAIAEAAKLAAKAEDPKTAGLIADASQEMKRAQQQLALAEKTTAPLTDALAAEQAAYNALLKIAAHEFRVNRSQQQGKGKGKQSDQQREQLEQLEMKDEKKRYEQQREAEAPQDEQKQEQLAVLNRLKELAQRQKDINERVKELQTAIEEAKTEKEREEAKRQLKRLREEEQQLLADVDELKQKLEQEKNQSRFAEERKQLEQTRNDAQQAAESMQRGESSRALAEGKRAEEAFEKMRDELRKKTSGQFKDEMRQMRNDARELAQRQGEIAEELKAKPKAGERRTLDGSNPREKLAEQFEQQQKALGGLREGMQRVSEQAEAVEPLLAKQLYDTLRENVEAGTDDTLQKAGELARRGNNPQAQQFEEKARGEVEKVKAGVEKAAESVLGDEAEAMRQAREQLDSLARQLDREIANARGELPEDSAKNRKSGDGATPDGAGDGKESKAGTGEPGEKPGTQPGDGKEPGKEGEGRSPSQGGKLPGEAKSPGEGEGKGSQPGGSKPGEGKEGKSGEGGQGQQPSPGEGKQPGEGKGSGEGKDGAQGQPGESKGSGEGKSGEGKGSEGKGSGEGKGAGEGKSGEGAQPGSQQAGARGNGSQPSAQPGSDAPRPQQGRTSLSQIANNAGTRGANGGATAAGGGGGLDGGLPLDPRAPLTGDGFVDWSDRLRNVEEMLDSPDLRRQAAEIREAAKVMRSEIKRGEAEPKWNIVKSQIHRPLTELRDRLSQELARRASKESLVPIDRDPVPPKYSDRVQRYYEELGRSR